MRIARPDVVRDGANAQAFDPSSIVSSSRNGGGGGGGPPPPRPPPPPPPPRPPRPPRPPTADGPRRIESSRATKRLALPPVAISTSRAATSYPVKRGAKPAGNSAGCISM